MLASMLKRVSVVLVTFRFCETSGRDQGNNRRSKHSTNTMILLTVVAIVAETWERSCHQFSREPYTSTILAEVLGFYEILPNVLES